MHNTYIINQVCIYIYISFFHTFAIVDAEVTDVIFKFLSTRGVQNRSLLVQQKCNFVLRTNCSENDISSFHINKVGNFLRKLILRDVSSRILRNLSLLRLFSLLLCMFVIEMFVIKRPYN